MQRSTHRAGSGRAAEDLLKQLGGTIPKLVMMFASRDRDQRALNRAVRERLPKGRGSSARPPRGEIDNNGMH